MSAGAETQAHAAPAPGARREHIPLAIFYMIASGAVFNCANAASKWLIATYPIGEVLFSRSLVALLTMAAFILPAAGWAVFRTQRLRAHAMRATSQVGSQTMLLIAFSLMPLAGATAIMFSSPIFSTLASAYFLHERVGAARWGVLLIGFLGVLVIAHPGADSFQIGALFALGNAILFGTVVAGVRGMSATESTETLIMYQLTFLTAAYALALPFGFITPTGFDTLLMIGSGVGNGAAQYLWTRAIHLAPTSAVVPFQYLQLVWAMLLGFAIWGDLPTAALLIGSAIVIASGMFLFWHETRKVPVADAA
ncbi:MAG: DMT family transporter [Alphaproteobacteria bacterium]|nr:MAG: DMT family transporter [Alphaproteobacteria bacterium]